jgi:uncharacterized protein
VTAAYFDSSAIVKLYANELHHEAVRDLVEVPICTSLARVEVIAAFFGKARSGEINLDVAEVLRDVFVADWSQGRFLHIAPGEPIETEAAQLASLYMVRGFDAIHLATALAARRALPELALFVCFDKRLNQAAASEQFDLLVVT